jgi:hypothetical protein
MHMTDTSANAHRTASQSQSRNAQPRDDHDRRQARIHHPSHGSAPTTTRHHDDETKIQKYLDLEVRDPQRSVKKSLRRPVATKSRPLRGASLVNGVSGLLAVAGTRRL